MQRIIAGIPSYFGEGETRIRRFKAHQVQLEWIENQKIPTFIYAQDYTSKEYSKSPLVTYKKFKEPDQWAVFKTMFLEHFYSTDIEWALLMDNDAGLYDHHLGYNIFQHMENFPHLWKNVDMWYPLDPRKEPFNHLYNAHPEIYRNNLILTFGSMTLKGTMIVLKNPKFSKKEPLFFPKEVKSSGDTDFLIRALMNEYRAYKNNSCILKEIVDSGKYSTIPWLADMKERAKLVAQDKIIFAQKYGIPYKERKNGGITFEAKKFYKKYVGKYPQTIAIPKEG